MGKRGPSFAAKLEAAADSSYLVGGLVVLSSYVISVGLIIAFAVFTKRSIPPMFAYLYVGMAPGFFGIGCARTRLRRRAMEKEFKP